MIDFSQFKLSNIRRGPLTTGFGLLIGLAAILSIFLTDRIGWLEVCGVITVITVPLALSSDQQIPKGPLMLALLGILALAAISCTKPLTSKTHTSTLDSTWSTEKIRLVTVGIPLEKTTLSLQVDCDPATGKPKPFSQTASGKRASVQATMSGQGKLLIAGLCDSLQTQIEVKDREIHRLKQSNTQTQTTIPVQYTAWYDIACRWLVILACCGYGSSFLLKRFLL